MGKKQELYAKMQLLNEKLGVGVEDVNFTIEELTELALIPINNPDPVIQLNLDGDITFFNMSAIATFEGIVEEGFEHPALMGISEILSQLKTQGDLSFDEEVDIGKSKYLRTISSSMNKEKSSIQIYYRDISHAKQAELKEKRLLVAIMDNIMQGVVTIDKTAKIKSFNKWAEFIFGYQAREVIGENVKILMPEPYHSQHDQYVHNFIDTGEEKIIGIGRDDLEGKRKNGETFPISLTITDIEIEEEILFVGLINDITERKKANDSLSMFQSVVESSSDGVMVTNRELNETGPKITYVNEAFSDITGYGTKDILGKTPRILQGEKTNRDTLDEIRRALENGSSFQGELQNYTKDGDVFWQQTSIFPVLNDKNEVVKFASTLRDISKQKEFVNELSIAREKAESANRAKSDFLANMSHELRTPLNSIIGMVQLINYSKPGEEIQDMFNTVKQSSENLLLIVNDILDLSKIEANELRFEFLGFDIVEKFRYCIQSLLHRASTKGVTLDFESNRESLLVLGDPLRFGQIVINLIGNALQYTNEGEVKVRLVLQPENDKYVSIHCEVEDTGIGIPKDKQAVVFEKFSQSDVSDTRVYGGTGLGLTITRELVKLMGGGIGFESEEGKGTTFWFDLRFELTGDQTQKIEDKEKNSKKKTHVSSISCDRINVLVAEDNQMNQQFVKKLFKHLFIENYLIVENGLDAFEQVQKNNYDLVLMDCHMPKMNGYVATQEIRKLSDIPIVAMTANAMPDDKKRCLDMGMDAYISKPIDIAILKETLAPWVMFHDGEESRSQDNTEDKDDEIPVILDNLIANSMGDDDFLKEMISMFVVQSKDQLDQLGGHCTGGYNEDWVERSHSLKGFAANIGAGSMRQLCATSQEMENATAQEREEMAAEIEAEYLKVKNYLIRNNYYKE